VRKNRVRVISQGFLTTKIRKSVKKYKTAENCLSNYNKTKNGKILSLKGNQGEPKSIVIRLSEVSTRLCNLVSSISAILVSSISVLLS
jgi:hypothetical protein